MRRFALSLALVAACSDPVAPPSPAKLIPKPSLLENEGTQPGSSVGSVSYSETASGEFQIPQVPSILRPQEQYCWDHLRIANQVVISNQEQILAWDDNNHYWVSNGQNIFQKDVVSGQFKITYRWWRGTYGGSELRCIKLDHIDLYDSEHAYFFKRLPSKGAFTHQGWAWCGGGYGSCVDTDPNGRASLIVTAFFHFGRNYNIDLPDGAGTQVIELGGLYCGVCTDPSLRTWSVEIFAWKASQPVQYAGGWWTALNYGGNGGQEYGFPTAKMLYDRWDNIAIPGALGQLANTAHWRVVGH